MITCHKESKALTSIWSTDLKTERSNDRLCSSMLLVPTTPIVPGIYAYTRTVDNVNTSPLTGHPLHLYLTAIFP